MTCPSKTCKILVWQYRPVISPPGVRHPYWCGPPGGEMTGRYCHIIKDIKSHTVHGWRGLWTAHTVGSYRVSTFRVILLNTHGPWPYVSGPICYDGSLTIAGIKHYAKTQGKDYLSQHRVQAVSRTHLMCGEIMRRRASVVITNSLWRRFRHFLFHHEHQATKDNVPSSIAAINRGSASLPFCKASNLFKHPVHILPGFYWDIPSTSR